MGYPDPQDEAGRMVSLVQDILPPTIYPKDAFDQVVQAIIEDEIAHREHMAEIRKRPPRP